LELLVVSFFICGLAFLSAFLLHPKNYQVERNNGNRWADIAAIAQAFNRYVAANGSLPAGLPTANAVIGSVTSTNFDLCKILIPTYLKEMPLDPVGGVDLSATTCADSGGLYLSGYGLRASGRTVTVEAPHAEGHVKISITRTY